MFFREFDLTQKELGINCGFRPGDTGFPERLTLTDGLGLEQKHQPDNIAMPGKTLAIFGSGPGIGVAVARAFSVRGFTHVALVSRDGSRLKTDQDQVLDAVQERGYSCQVKTWQCDLTDFDQLKSTLSDIENFGSLECVLYNAARVAGGPPLEESTEEIEQDFRVSLFSVLLVRKLWLTISY